MQTQSMDVDTVGHVCGLRGVGPAKAKIAIVGIAPGKQEIKHGRPFVGDSGKLLNAILDHTGLKREEVLVTNLLCWWKNEPNTDDINACWPRLRAELQEREVDVIFALGNAVIEQLTELRPSKVRHLAIWNDEFEAWVIGTWHPAAALRGSNDDMVTDIIRDFNKASLYLAKQPRDFSFEMKLITTQTEVEWLFNRLSHETTLCLDVEYPGNCERMACFAIRGASSEVTYVVTNMAILYVRPKHWQRLVANKCRWVFHNGVYDAEQVYREWKVLLRIDDDTMLMSYTLDMRGGGDDDTYGVGYHGLKRLAGEYCGAQTYGIDLRKYPENEAEWRILYEYNARDVEYTMNLWWHFMFKVGGRSVYKGLLIPAANALLSSKLGGVPIDRDKLLELAVEWDTQISKLEASIAEMARVNGWQDELNPNSPQQLSRFLYETLGLKKPLTKSMSKTRTDVEALQQLQHPFVDLLLEYRRVDKMLSTYVVGIERALQGSHVHPTPLLHGTRTGRLSYKNPPVQTIPRGFMVGSDYGRVRSLFGDVEGESVFVADYEQAELWTAVMYTGDTVMLEALQAGDFHSSATEAMFGVSRDTYEGNWKKLREQSKTVTFGVLYGRGAKALSKAELSEYTVAECQAFIDAWYRRFEKTKEWIAQQQELMLLSGEQYTLSGRKFEYPSSLNPDQLNKAANYPIQSTAHDVLLHAYVELQPILWELGGNIWFETHDAIIGSVPDARREFAEKLIKQHMSRPRFGYNFGIPVEIKWGTNWQDAV